METSEIRVLSLTARWIHPAAGVGCLGLPQARRPFEGLTFFIIVPMMTRFLKSKPIDLVRSVAQGFGEEICSLSEARLRSRRVTTSLFPSSTNFEVLVY